MFDDMYFQKTCSIDSKRRIALPPSTGVLTGTRLALACINKEYYHLYLLEQLNSVVEHLQSDKISSVNDEARAKYLAELNAIFGMIKEVVKVDRERRIILPSSFYKPSEKKVILQGRKDHIGVFATEESYNNYQRNLKKSSYLK